MESEPEAIPLRERVVSKPFFVVPQEVVNTSPTHTSKVTKRRTVIGVSRDLGREAVEVELRAKAESVRARQVQIDVASLKKKCVSSAQDASGMIQCALVYLEPVAVLPTNVVLRFLSAAQPSCFQTEGRRLAY